MNECVGIRLMGNHIVACSNITAEMLEQLERDIRVKIMHEVEAFANDYHHHVNGRDVVIVEQLLAFLTPVERKEQDGLGTIG